MQIPISILSKTIVAEFFKNYAVHFFIGFYFCFGILRIDQEHIAINTYFLSNPPFILVYFGIWTLYNLVVLQFFSSSIRKNELKFLYQLYLYPPKVRFISLLNMQLLLLSPVIAYSIFTLNLAIKLHAWHYVVLAPVFIGFTLLYSTFSYLKKFQNPDISPSQGKFQLPFLSKIPKPSWSFYLYELSLKQPLLFFFSKSISCIFLWSCLTFFIPDDNQNLRPLLLGLILSFAASSPLAALFHSYENNQLLYFKNLPLTRNHLLVRALIIFSILSMPEILLGIRLLPQVQWSLNLIGALLFLPSLLALYYSAIYHPKSAESNFGNYLFGVGFLFFMLILFGLPSYVFIIICGMGSTYFLYLYFYNFEVILKEK